MINEILSAVPCNILDTTGNINFYLYGSPSSLRKMMGSLKEKQIEFSFSELKGGICIHEAGIFSRDYLEGRHQFYLESCENLLIEYDGFDLNIENGEEKAVFINEFQPDFKPGDLFSYCTKEGKYIAGVYYGGSYNDIGCLFNIYDYLFDKEEEIINKIDGKDFLYRTPVLLMIDSKAVKKLELNKYTDCSCFFRAEIGEKSLEYFQESGLDGDYIAILHSMYEKREILYLSDWLFIEFKIKKGKVSSSYLSPLKKPESSYHFGVVGNMDMAESRIKRKNKDLVFLSDEVLKVA
ncbi:hypothetical protein [Neisseria dentiae]|uniref:hypothetical protein n=1 Tax=Neisseria dentiae TaxID=194197 RepID=UPI00359FA970